MSEFSRKFYVPEYLKPVETFESTTGEKTNEDTELLDLNTIAHKAIRDAEADYPRATKEEQIRVVLGAISIALTSSGNKPHKSILKSNNLD